VSRGGFRSTLGTATTLTYAHGIWDGDPGGVLSNYRELINLVDTLEQGAQLGQLHHTEVWIFTDNSTSEEIFGKGTHTAPC
jgi:hypothetical protein